MADKVNVVLESEGSDVGELRTVSFCRGMTLKQVTQIMRHDAEAVMSEGLTDGAHGTLI